MAAQRLVERVALTVTYDDGLVETFEGACESITRAVREGHTVAIGADQPALGPQVLDVEVRGLVVA